MNRRSVALALALALSGAGLTACSPPSSARGPAASPSTSPSGYPATSSPPEAAAGDGPALAAFKNCDELSGRMRDLAMAEIDRNGSGLYGGSFDRAQTSDERVRIAGPAADPSADGPAASDFDTPSALKTNGALVLTKTDQKLLISDFSGSAPMKAGQLSGPGLYGGGQILLAGNRALVLVRARQNSQRTILTLVDLTDPAHPSIVQQETVQADYVIAARSGGVFRVVITSTPDIHSRITPKGAQEPSAAELKAEAADLAATGWLPKRQVTDGAGKTVVDGPLLDCTQIRRPPEDTGSELLTALTIDPTRDDALSSAAPLGIVTGSDQVALSPTRMLVATNKGWGSPQETFVDNTPTAAPLPSNPRTRIHEFDVAGRATAYLGSAEIDGYVDGPGGLSARDGVVRVVTTSMPSWWYDRPGQSAAHAVTILKQQAGSLVATATMPIDTADRKLGVIRWFDDLLAVAPRPGASLGNPMSPGYDANKGSGPLHLVDLSNPAGPVDRGALAVSDGAAQLVALGDGRIAAIGTRPVGPGVNDEPELATFDLTDPSAPKRLDSVGLGTGSLATDGALAWPSRHLIIVPGFARLGSSCTDGERCAAPTSAVCDQPGGCVDAYPLDGTREARGAAVFTVDADGSLHLADWVTSHRDLSRWLRVGDHFAAWSQVGVNMVDLDFHILGTVPIRQATQP